MSIDPAADDESSVNELAGEYVLGTLPARQHDDVRKRIINDARLRAAVQEWEDRLLPLASLAHAVEPPKDLWSRIAQSTDSIAPHEPARTAPRLTPKSSTWPGWHSLAFWRGLSVAGFAATAVLALLLFGQPDRTPSAPQYVVVLVGPQDKAPGWIIQASSQQDIRLIPLGMTQVPSEKALQFWTKADDWKGPVSLGLVKPGETLQIAMSKLPPLQNNQLFELTLEPSTGSPIGRPTGPIQFIGRAVKTM